MQVATADPSPVSLVTVFSDVCSCFHVRWLFCWAPISLLFSRTLAFCFGPVFLLLCSRTLAFFVWPRFAVVVFSFGVVAGSGNEVHGDGILGLAHQALLGVAVTN